MVEKYFFLDLNGEIKKYNSKTEYFKTNRRQLISLWGWSLCLCIIGKMWRGSPTDLFHSSVFLPGPAGICIQVPFFSAEKCSRTSLVVRGIRICLPMQGAMGSIPGLGRFHRQLAHEPQPLSLPGCNYRSPLTSSLCSATREATAMRSPHTTTRESPHKAMKIQNSQKEKKCSGWRRRLVGGSGY